MKAGSLRHMAPESKGPNCQGWNFKHGRYLGTSGLEGPIRANSHSSSLGRRPVQSSAGVLRPRGPLGFLQVVLSATSNLAEREGSPVARVGGAESASQQVLGDFFSISKTTCQSGKVGGREQTSLAFLEIS